MCSVKKRLLILGLLLFVILAVGFYVVKNIKSEDRLLDIQDPIGTSTVDTSQASILSSTTIAPSSSFNGSLWKVVLLEDLVIYDPNGFVYDRGTFENIQSGEIITGQCVAPGWNDPEVGKLYRLQIFTDAVYPELNYKLLIPLDEDLNDPYQRFNVE